MTILLHGEIEVRDIKLAHSRGTEGDKYHIAFAVYYRGEQCGCGVETEVPHLREHNIDMLCEAIARRFQLEMSAVRKMPNFDNLVRNINNALDHLKKQLEIDDDELKNAHALADDRKHESLPGAHGGPGVGQPGPSGGDFQYRGRFILPDSRGKKR